MPSRCTWNTTYDPLGETAAWVGTPTGSDLLRFQIVYDVMVGIVGLIGLVWVVRRWRRYRIDRWTEAHPRPTRHRV